MCLQESRLHKKQGISWGVGAHILREGFMGHKFNRLKKSLIPYEGNHDMSIGIIC